jgi:hypothetical protein
MLQCYKEPVDHLSLKIHQVHSCQNTQESLAPRGGRREHYVLPLSETRLSFETSAFSPADNLVEQVAGNVTPA